MTTVEVRSGPVGVERGGSGWPVLWLSSSFGEAPWLPVHQLVSEHHLVVAPHPPTLDGVLGRIRSMDDYVLHLEELLDALGLNSAAVVGTSFGGWVAAELAARQPTRVDALVLIDAMGLRVPGQPAAEIFAPPLPQLAALVLHDRRAADPRALPAFDPSADPLECLGRLIAGQEAMARLGWSPYLHDPALEGRLERYRGPALVVWGSDDRVLPEGHAHRWCELLGAEMRVVEPAGHLPAVEQPEQTARVVLEWLAVQLPAQSGQTRP
ncbi:MAG TPA: alpha/beta hydrolase [Acidimicrobiales bacterium]|nr:alpha/beta hydrolase [Acidimicrobiales bacterium]